MGNILGAHESEVAWTEEQRREKEVSLLNRERDATISSFPC